MRIRRSAFFHAFITPLAATALTLAIMLCDAAAAEIAPVKFATPNGMTVVILEQHYVPIVEVHALIKAGSSHDLPERAGLANLVASLLDEGTTTRTSKQLAEQIDFVGGALEVKAGEDFTTASARVLKKDVDLAFTLLADILQHPVFNKQDFERIRGQVLGEMASDNDDPGHVAMKAFNQLVFHGHPYRWPLNGTEETVGKITPADVAAFYSKEYVPGQVILTVVGDVTAEQITGLTQTHFGSWKKAALPVRTNKKAAPLEKKTVQLIEKDLMQSSIVLGHGGISRTNPDFYAVTVMNYILGSGGFSSRLMDSIRDKQGLAYGIMSHFDARYMPGSFWISLQTRSEATNQAINGVLAEVKAIRESPVSDQELADAKSFLMGSFPLRLDSTAKLAQVLAQVEFYGLGFEYFSQYPKWIERVTKDDVQRVAKQYLDPHRYAMVVVGNLTKAKIKH
ncbi:putative Zn-dependent peptidase, M16 family [Nitrospira sp. KM1]|uniref:M16 family metallopeptidase n=1 Tax=Nitrospira sp. KM1 TaxID=1936990 RepID=UPI0013A78E9B|nr:pitrilysin family protein [Nitrospira sp. KM1]BCA54733.1 putative Zn-dependent peptidase, M16 family [Nitrospira sp. KM1]